MAGKIRFRIGKTANAGRQKMFVPLFVSFLIGGAGVLQNTFNQRIGNSLGLPLTLLMNSFVLFGSSLLLFLAVRYLPAGAVAELYQEKNVTGFPWRALLPGLLGFFIVATAPYTIGKIGATRVFIAVIVAQIVVSLLWDLFAESIPVSPTRLAGAGLALLGAILAAR
jgi:uncharacterized membrane protein YdcZ (DUF606 family)